MIPRLENAVLVTDLDFDSNDLLNCTEFSPVPSGLVSINDPRLDDVRAVANDSVTNASIAANAAIDQSKLDLDGDMPAAWIGNTSVKAAEGDLVQFLSEKSAVDGYVALDANGQVDSGDLPTIGPQTGTVTKVGLLMPVDEFDVANSTITTTGTFVVTWADQPDGSYFGVNGPVGLSPIADVPSFLVKPFPVALIPDLAGGIFTTGVFAVGFLPEAIGMGVTHAQGILPDPGESSDGISTQYIGRDMEWHSFNADVSYQPYVPDVNIFVASYSDSTAKVTIRSTISGSSLFYQIPSISTFFLLAPLDTQNPKDVHITLTMGIGAIVRAYAAKAGYNNSPVATFIVPPAPVT